MSEVQHDLLSTRDMAVILEITRRWRHRSNSTPCLPK